MPYVPLTEQVDLTIASKELPAGHPELHHYTRYAGLKGILESNTLRGTHYRKLNDAMELSVLRRPLSLALGARFVEVLKRRQSEPEIGRAIEETGGLQEAARLAAEGLVNAFYQVSFENRASFSFAEPYITSFCTHAHWPYERDNGLLSQWRGYGGGGGYSLVFDTAKLAERLGREFDSHYYVHISMNEVVYADGSSSVEELFPLLLERNEGFLNMVLDHGDGLGDLQDGFGPFIAGVTSYKHQGFREESEIRVVSIPATQQVADQVRQEHPGVTLSAIKRPQIDERGRPFIPLFSTLDGALPVKRIIVGPSPNQQGNAEQARALTKGAIPIVLSETPYIELPTAS